MSRKNDGFCNYFYNNLKRDKFVKIGGAAAAVQIRIVGRPEPYAANGNRLPRKGK